MATGTHLQSETLGYQSDALRIIFETVPVGVVVIDRDGRLLFSNSPGENILGLGAGDAATLDWTAVHGWYLLDKTTLLTPGQLPLMRALGGEEIIDEVIFVRNFAQSKGTWISVSARPLASLGVSLSGAVMIFHDVTERRRELQTSLLLSRVVEQTADSVMLTDKQGTIEYVNPAFVATTGFSRSEALGKTPRILKSGLHDAEFYRQIWNRLMEGQAFHGMVINRKKSGDLCWTQQAITPIRDEQGSLTHFVSVLQDITQLRKKQEQEFQLRMAREVQQQFYEPAPAVPGFDIGAGAYPAYETGGDYFDFIRMSNDCLAIAVGDVQGHGFGAALVMALTRAYLRSFAVMDMNPGQILTQVNRMLVKDLEGHFVTLALARLDLRQQTLAYAGAGHVPGFVLQGPNDEKCVLESNGPPLGLFPESTYSCQKTIQLERGDIVVLLTDGITESMTPDGNDFGLERALAFIRAHRGDPASRLVDGMFHAARAFVNHEPQVDDITAVVLKVDPKAEDHDLTGT